MKKMTNDWYFGLGITIFLGLCFIACIWALFASYDEEKLENNPTLEEIYKNNRTNNVNTE